MEGEGSSTSRNAEQSLMKRWWRTLIAVADSLFTMDQREWAQLMKDNLCTVAALVASITFQAALNPPGGVVQTSTTPTGEKDQYSTPVACTLNDQDPTRALCTATSVSAAIDSGTFSNFLYVNTFSFITALLCALLLVNGMPLRHGGFPIWLLSVIMSLSLTTLGLSYLYGVVLVTPVEMLRTTDRGFSAILYSGVAFSSFVVLFNTVRFFVSLVRERRRSKGGDQENGSQSQN